MALDHADGDGARRRLAEPRLADWLLFVLVSTYLAAAGTLLALLGRISLTPSWRSVAGGVVRRLRGNQRASGVIQEVVGESGHCYLARMPWFLISDAEGRSRLQLWEDDRPLGPAHCGHDDVRSLGGGRYSHWGRWMYFSSSDNTDPRLNSRVYRYAELADEHLSARGHER